MKSKVAVLLVLLACCGRALADAAAAPATNVAPFNCLYAVAAHVLPGTHNNESGYFSLVEGRDGKLYIGTAKYGENAYLVDPKTKAQRIVIDTNQVTGATGKGHAAQSKIPHQELRRPVRQDLRWE